MFCQFTFYLNLNHVKTKVNEIKIHTIFVFYIIHCGIYISISITSIFSSAVSRTRISFMFLYIIFFEETYKLIDNIQSTKCQRRRELKNIKLVFLLKVKKSNRHLSNYPGLRYKSFSKRYCLFSPLTLCLLTSEFFKNMLVVSCNSQNIRYINNPIEQICYPQKFVTTNTETVPKLRLFVKSENLIIIGNEFP